MAARTTPGAGTTIFKYRRILNVNMKILDSNILILPLLDALSPITGGVGGGAYATDNIK